MHPPDRKSERAALAGSPQSQSNSHDCVENLTHAASELQAEKLRRLYRFCHATACTFASLAFAVSR
jgi:hypothetical protein